MLFRNDPDFPENDARKQLAPILQPLSDAVLEAAEDILAVGREYPLFGKAYEYQATRQKMMNSLGDCPVCS